ncbi:MAG TPA: UPF0280 family protein [Clostridiales bacterium]|nr:UPF0280 family protein [Clostridiales bacterium]
MFQNKHYRQLFSGKDLTYFTVSVKETDLRIGASKNLYDVALQSVIKYRRQIEQYIKSHKTFLTSLTPVGCESDCAYIIKRMCKAAHKAGVGPMACVAGIISELVAIDLLKHSEEIIVENGGDIFIKTNSPRKVGIYAGTSPFNNRLGMVIEPQHTPMGICTSAGKIGHSLSFGHADAVTVLSKDTALADAAATAVGNMVKTPRDIDRAIAFARTIDGVLGVIIIIDDSMGAWGDIKIVKL